LLVDGLKAPVASADIAKEASLDPELLYRSLRALASEGLFVETPNKEVKIESMLLAVVVVVVVVRTMNSSHGDDTAYTLFLWTVRTD